MAFKLAYPSLHEIGLTSCMLMAVADDSDNDSKLRSLTVSTVTNKIVYELYHFRKMNPPCTYQTLWQWLACLCEDRWSDENFPTVSSVRQSVLRIVSKVTKLKKMPNSKEKYDAIETFLETPYSFPEMFTSGTSCAAVQKQHSHSSCSSCAEAEVLKSVNVKLCQEIADLKDQTSSLDELSECRKKGYSLHRNMVKKLKRRELVIEQQRVEVNDSRKTISMLQQTVAKNESQIINLQRKIDRIQHRALYWKKKSDELKESFDDKVDEVIIESEEVKVKLREEIDELESRTAVEEIVDDSMKTIVGFEKGKYTDNIRACCYELLSLNVGVKNVKPIINSVLNHIAKKEIDRLPGKTVLCNMMLECLSLAQIQLGEELSKEDGEFYTLQTDGTTKHGVHFGTYDIATLDKTYSLGLRHVFSGSAQNTLETLMEILDDLDVVRRELGHSAVSGQIIHKIKNTMSDRHAAEKKFAEVLSAYRADILPDVVANWEQMSLMEQEQLTRMNNFFCGLHFLVGLADAAEAALKQWELSYEEDDGKEKKSSGVQRLVRTACKAFHHKGSEQAGCSTHFRAYLRHQGVSKIPLAAFVGNRFNILFYDAAGVYFLNMHMVQYLTKYHGGALNRLLSAVLHDLQTPHLIAGCQALGIVDKLITGPFWRYLQTSTISVLGMSDTYTMMKAKFEEWGSNSECLVGNQDSLFEEHVRSNDDVSEFLFKPTTTSQYGIVVELLQVLCKAFSLTIQRLLVDHLPGGEFHGVSDSSIISETKSVPKTNVSPERDFAILDRLISQKPNATYIALESMLLFSVNKTTDWLKSKNPEEKEKLLQASRNLTAVQRSTFRKRREEIEAKRAKAIEVKEKEMVAKKEKELKMKEDLTKGIQQIGLWTSPEDIEAGLASMSSKKAKVSALKLQLNFRRKVLNQTHDDPTIFQFSKNRFTFSVEQLAQNLHKLLLGDSSKVKSSLVISSPDTLVYRRIEHLFDCDGELVWFKGTVLSYNPNNNKFTVAYDNEKDFFEYPLLDDLKTGELKIIS